MADKAEIGTLVPSGAFKAGDDPRRGHGLPGRSGRRPAAFTLACQGISDRLQLAEVAAKIAAGELGEKVVAGNGEIIYTDTKNSDRLAAIKLLWSYGYGAPPQTLTLDEDPETPILSPLVDLARQLTRLAARAG